MYDIFRRINTGGTPLNAQEIRHCMSRQRSRDFLLQLTRLPIFNAATGGVLENQRRMIDREVALRFAAFWFTGAKAYRDQTMEEFLWNATERIDDVSKTPPLVLEELMRGFVLALKNSLAIFGDHTFRKWPIGDERLKPFNRALFESWTVELAYLGVEIGPKSAERIRIRARNAMTSDVEYIASITASTGDRRRVKKRFETARTLISESIA